MPKHHKVSHIFSHLAHSLKNFYHELHNSSDLMREIFQMLNQSTKKKKLFWPTLSQERYLQLGKTSSLKVYFTMKSHGTVIQKCSPSISLIHRRWANWLFSESQIPHLAYRNNNCTSLIVLLLRVGWLICKIQGHLGIVNIQLLRIPWMSSG